MGKFFDDLAFRAVLADLAAKVREELPHVTMADIAKRGGPSEGVVRRLEHYRAGDQPWRMRRSTLSALDDGFEWKPNTAQDLYDREPTAEIGASDIDGFADLVARRVVHALAERMQIRIELADAAQPS